MTDYPSIPFGQTLSALVGQPPPDQPFQPDFQNADNMAGDGIGLLNQQGQAANTPAPLGVTKYSVTTKSDGTVMHNVEMDDATFNQFQTLAHRGAAAQPLMGLAQIGQQVLDARNQQVKALQGRLAEIQAHPILAQLGRIASLAGAAYIAPNSRLGGLVRAASAFSAPLLSDTEENLTAQIAGAEQEKLQAALPIAQLAERQQEQQTEAANTAFNQNLAVQTLKERQANNLQERVQASYNRAAISAQKGVIPEEKSTVQKFIDDGATPREAKTMFDDLVSTARGAVAEETRRVTERTDAQIRENKARIKEQQTGIAAARESAALDREARTGFDIYSAASDRYNKANTEALEASSRIMHDYQSMFPGEPLPSTAQAMVGRMRDALANPKNKDHASAQAYAANYGDIGKFQTDRANDLGKIEGFAASGQGLLRRAEAAKQMIPPKFRDVLSEPEQQGPAAPTAAPVQPKLKAADLDKMDYEGIKAAVAAGKTDVDQQTLAALYAKKRPKKTTLKDVASIPAEITGAIGRGITGAVQSTFGQ